ncbi:Protein PLM2, partial [Smittium mucronatum]
KSRLAIPPNNSYYTDSSDMEPAAAVFESDGGSVAVPKIHLSEDEKTTIINQTIEYMANYMKNVKVTLAQIISHLAPINAKVTSDAGPALLDILASNRCFGVLHRSNLDANGKKVCDLFYYDNANDPNIDRRMCYQQVAKRVRKCTLVDAQYYYKPIPKLR